ncbi:MAG: serine protease [Phormidium sp.]
MNWHLSIVIACTGIYLTQMPVQAFPENVAPAIPTSPQLSTEQLRQLAKAITVKVFSGDTWGSGILIRQQGQVYTVLTNDHVLTAGYGKQFRIQTSDDRIYPATVTPASQFNGNDLALLQFRSSANYRIALLETSAKLAVGDEVFAAGFPIESNGFVFNSGKISLILVQALQRGYQIGYTNEIVKGMSGGPVLNNHGEVVGINAMHAYPLWGNFFVFQDGSQPSLAMQQQMMQLSWAVPVATFLQMTEKLPNREVWHLPLSPRRAINRKQPDGWLW